MLKYLIIAFIFVGFSVAAGLAVGMGHGLVSSGQSKDNPGPRQPELSHAEHFQEAVSAPATPVPVSDPVSAVRMAEAAVPPAQPALPQEPAARQAVMPVVVAAPVPAVSSVTGLHEVSMLPAVLVPPAARDEVSAIAYASASPVAVSVAPQARDLVPSGASSRSSSHEVERITPEASTVRQKPVRIFNAAPRPTSRPVPRAARTVSPRKQPPPRADDVTDRTFYRRSEAHIMIGVFR